MKLTPLATVLVSTATLFTEVVAAAAVADKESKTESPPELDPTNFNETVEHDIAWVKFYSPYCHHCISFAPTWDSLYAQYKDLKGLKMASVNCASQGDLCESKKIRAFPSIVLFENGKEVDKMLGAREEDVLVPYIRDQVERYNRKDDTMSTTKFPVFDKDTERETDNSKKYDGTESNIEGKSVELDQKTFTRKVTSTSDSWFVNFYRESSQNAKFFAVWDQVAIASQGRLNIGHVNCDLQRNLCKDAGVGKNQTPLLKFFASSMQTEYTGLNGLGDLLQFVERAEQARNPKEIDFDEFKNIQKNSEEVVYVYVYDKATAVEDFQALEKLAVSVVGTVGVVKSKDPRVAKALGTKFFPSLYAISMDGLSMYEAQSSQEIRDLDRMREWALNNRGMLVPQLTPGNADDIFRPQIVVLGLLDPRDKASFQIAMTELRATAKEIEALIEIEDAEKLHELRKQKQLKVDEAVDRGDKKAEESANNIKVDLPKREQIGVAWVDAVFWERWVKSRYGDGDGDEHSHGNRVVINEERQGRYWDHSVSGELLVPSRTNILETLEAVMKPFSGLQSNKFDKTRYFWRLVSDHWMLTLMVVSICGTGYYKYVQKKKRSSHEGYLGKFE